MERYCCFRAELFSSHGSENPRSYYDTLADQVTARDATKVERMKSDVSEQQRHFEAWDGFWGRPGYGAPKQQGLDFTLSFLFTKVLTEISTVGEVRIPFRFDVAQKG